MNAQNLNKSKLLLGQKVYVIEVTNKSWGATRQKWLKQLEMVEKFLKFNVIPLICLTSFYELYNYVYCLH